MYTYQLGIPADKWKLYLFMYGFIVINANHVIDIKWHLICVFQEIHDYYWMISQAFDFFD